MLRFLPPSQHPNSSYPLLQTRSSQRVARLSSVQLAVAAVAMRVTERQLTLAALPQLPTITHNLNQWKQLHLKLWRHFQSASEAAFSCTNHCIRDSRSHSTRNRTGPTGDFHVSIKSHHRNCLVQRRRIRLLATFRVFFFFINIWSASAARPQLSEHHSPHDFYGNVWEMKNVNCSV